MSSFFATSNSILKFLYFSIHLKLFQFLLRLLLNLQIRQYLKMLLDPSYIVLSRVICLSKDVAPKQ